MRFPRDDFNANSQGSAWEAEGQPAEDEKRERKAARQAAKLAKKAKN